MPLSCPNRDFRAANPLYIVTKIMPILVPSLTAVEVFLSTIANIKYSEPIPIANAANPRKLCINLIIIGRINVENILVFAVTNPIKTDTNTSIQDTRPRKNNYTAIIQNVELK